MKRILPLLLLLGMALWPRLALADATTPTPLTFGTWTDLGAGPLSLQADQPVNWAISSTTPTFSVNGGYFLAAKTTKDISTSSHVFVTPVQAVGTTNAYYAPISSSGSVTIGSPLGQTTKSASIPVTIASDQYSDPCATGALHSTADLHTSTGTGVAVVAGQSSKRIYLCSIDIVASAAANVSLIEGSSSTCGTSNTAGVYLNDTVTAGNGAAFAANGGVARGSGDSTLAATATNANYLCVLFTTSNSPQVNVHVSYVQQ